MGSPSARSFRLRGAAAALAALLVSASALAPPRASEKATCCVSGAPTCCCVDRSAPRDASAGCCRQALPEETAPSVQSIASSAFAAPAEIARELPDPSLAAPLAGPSRRVAPRARSAPLFLLFAALLV